MNEENESVIVVGTRPTLPNHQMVDLEESEQSLRCRGSYGSSTPETFYSMDAGHAGPTASTPAQAPFTDQKRRRYPSFGTPGSLADLCPDQLYLAPLEVRDTLDDTPATEDLKLKLDQSYQIDSGFGTGASLSSSSCGSRKSSLFDPFPNPEGSYVSNSSIWEMFTPVRDLRKKWKGRPSYLDDSKTMKMDKFSFDPQQLLGCLMLMVISASVGFTFLISFRNMDGSSMEGLNSKYKSIEFGSQKLVDKLRKEGRLLEGVRDEDGNMLGGKKASIQFSYEQGLKKIGGVEVKVVDIGAEVVDKVGEEKESAVAKDVQAGLVEQVGKDDSGLAQGILEAADKLKNTDEAQVKKLQDEVRELEKQKRHKLELIKKVKMFNKNLMKVAPKPMKFERDEEVVKVDVNVKTIPNENQEAKPKKKSKSHANPLTKSAPKKLRISKAKASSVVIKPSTIEEKVEV